LHFYVCIFYILFLIFYFASMSILVINSGSTSLKYKIFGDDEKEIRQGYLENIKDHSQALKSALREIGDLREVKAVGHRVVHGGDKYNETIEVNEAIMADLVSFNDLAPLHNPYNLAGIKAAQEYLPDLPQVAVFDTAFFCSLPQLSRIYALPEQLTEKYKIHRFGFHGLSHQYILSEAARKLKKAINRINLISCHLGGGWSVTAVKAGQPIDTSMGWTPLEGLVMMTRCGDLDPGIILKLLKILPGEVNEKKVDQLYDLLNNRSGIYGLTGLTDFLQLIKKVSLGDESAKLAFDLAVNRLIKYIGAYWVLLDAKVDAVVFTGAIGSGNPLTRNRIINKIKCLGETEYLAIKTNEEIMIAREVKKLLNLKS